MGDKPPQNDSFEKQPSILSSLSSSSENTVIRKLHLSQSKNLTKMYKKIYAKFTNKMERYKNKKNKRKLSSSKTSAKASSDSLEEVAVNSRYTEEEDDNVFITKFKTEMG